MSEQQTAGEEPQQYIDLCEWDDEALALEGRKGSKEARNALYMRRRTRVNRLATRARRYLRLSAWAYAEPPLTYADIEQQAFIAFCELLGAWIPEESSFSAFLVRKLPSKLLHYVRDTLKPHRMAPANRAHDEESEAASREEANPVERWGELPPNWEYLTGSLSYRERVAVTMRYWDDLPASRIAEIRGGTRRTVNRDLRRAREAIRRKIEGDDNNQKPRARSGA